MKANPTLLLFLLLTTLILAFSWTGNIVFTDELIYEEAAYQMQQTGDYLTPRQGDAVWLERPPLYFWVTAAIYQAASPTPFTRRLPTLIAAIATLALTYRLARQWFSQTTARWAMVILTTTPLYFFFTKTANLDIPAACFISLTLLAYEKAKSRPRWLLITAAALGLGIMTRSFLALTPLPVILVDQFLSVRKIPINHLVLALALSLAIILPWHLAVFRQHPDIFRKDYLAFNISKHLFTQTPGLEPRTRVQFLFRVLGSYNPLALLALANFLPTRRRGRRIPRLLAIWIPAVLLPLTLAATRNEWYAIQVLPPLAILSGQGLVRIQQRLDQALTRPIRRLIELLSLTAVVTLPTIVLLNLPLETKSVRLLRRFIDQTPAGTPLYNLDHRYTPQTTLFNPREVEVTEPEKLASLPGPIYLYVDDPRQFSEVQARAGEFTSFSVIAEDRGAKLMRIETR